MGLGGGALPLEVVAVDVGQRHLRGLRGQTAWIEASNHEDELEGGRVSDLAVPPDGGDDGEELLPPQPREGHAKEVRVHLGRGGAGGGRNRVGRLRWEGRGTWKARVPRSMSSTM